MKISARNQLAGRVRKITEGAVMTEIVVELDGGQEVVAAITAESARRLGLAEGSRVVALVKSTEVMIAVED
ncbi:MAG TPA: TOBE domain-containing protein [Patescibacteria group bacterium]|nr:TOBE domain-containing protein [Patescibacteria group bacterium]